MFEEAERDGPPTETDELPPDTDGLPPDTGRLPPDTGRLPRAALPAGSTRALLHDDAVVLVRKRSRRRIPFEAVERVDGPGQDNRTLRIELTSAHGAGEILTLRGDDAEALRGFATALASALPARPRGEPRQDGRRLMSVETIALVPARDLLSADGVPALRTLTVLYVVAFPVVVLASENPVDSLVDWVCAGALLVPGTLLARLTASAVRTACLLRLRGVTVTGSLTGTTRRSGTGEPATYRYAFTDREGTVHHHEGQGWPLSDDGRTTRITYDPRAPERSYAPGDRMSLPAHAVVGAIGLVLLLLGLDFAATAVLDTVRVLRDSW
ncbi:DUF3592 domain-containing protein [Streptomyces sp. I05A-00742]|uniref:DUF3592 domain-containing protein n=1 Tax=Streptomyces sp. I05A-00742 TaxID=2732853 RepID=UPI0014889DFA|nr:DUF3592 domain-containing protein [Streptomyces sp. I05A-00742]